MKIDISDVEVELRKILSDVHIHNNVERNIILVENVYLENNYYKIYFSHIYENSLRTSWCSSGAIWDAKPLQDYLDSHVIKMNRDKKLNILLNEG